VAAGLHTGPWAQPRPGALVAHVIDSSAARCWRSCAAARLARHAHDT
jgi:hypothetical protein